MAEVTREEISAVEEAMIGLQGSLGEAGALRNSAERLSEVLTPLLNAMNTEGGAARYNEILAVVNSINFQGLETKIEAYRDIKVTNVSEQFVSGGTFITTERL
jgi:hypothetical protein